MICGFRDKNTEKIWKNRYVRTIPPKLQKIALRKLLMLHAAEELKDLLIPPGNRLEHLRGDRRGLYSIRINDQYRICFRWEANNAHDVEITDYH